MYKNIDIFHLKNIFKKNTQQKVIPIHRKGLPKNKNSEKKSYNNNCIFNVYIVILIYGIKIIAFINLTVLML